MASPKKKRLRYLEMEANVLLETKEQEIKIERLTEQNDALETITIREETKLESAKVKTKTKAKSHRQNNRNNYTNRKKNR